jgi:predicted amidophosphoribosyltransferase
VLDSSLKMPAPRKIILFDDVLTTGASFKAAQTLLRENFPNAPIAGIFIARNIKLPADNLGQTN